MGSLRTPWTRQPQYCAGVDWSNPLTRGLSSLYSPGGGLMAVPFGVDSVSNLDAITSGAGVSAGGPVGLAVKTDGDSSSQSLIHSGQASWGNTLTVLCVYVVRSTPAGVRRVLSNYESAVRGFYIGTNTTNHRAIYVGTGVNRTITGSAVTLGRLKTDVLVLGSSGVYYENGVQSGPPGLSYSGASSGDVYLGADEFGLNGVHCDVFCYAIWKRLLSPDEVRRVSQNPWQLFAPLPRRRTFATVSIFDVSIIESAAASDSPNAALTLSSDISESVTITAIESAVNSVTRPNSDVTTTGWTASTGSDLYAMIDESIASDTDYITSPDLTSGASTTIHGLTQSLAIGTYTVRFRSEKATAPTRSVRIHLMDGSSTIVGSSGWQAVTASYALYEVSITTSALATRVGIEAQ